jgi:hypothetical protein
MEQLERSHPAVGRCERSWLLKECATVNASENVYEKREKKKSSMDLYLKLIILERRRQYAPIHHRVLNLWWEGSSGSREG